MSLKSVTVSLWFISGPRASTTVASAATLTRIVAAGPLKMWSASNGMPYSVDFTRNTRREGPKKPY